MIIASTSKYYVVHDSFVSTRLDSFQLVPSLTNMTI